MKLRIDALVGLKKGKSIPWARLTFFLVDRDRAIAPTGPQVQRDTVTRSWEFAKDKDGVIRTGAYGMFANEISADVAQCVIDEAAENPAVMEQIAARGTARIIGWREIDLGDEDVATTVLNASGENAELLTFGESAGPEQGARPTHPAFAKIAKAREAQA